MDTPQRTLEEITEQTVDTFNQSARECLVSCQDRIRERPVSTVLGAAAAGYLLQFLPVTAIASALLRCAFALLKPALLILGAMKILSCLQGKHCGCEETEPLVDSPPGPVDIPGRL